ncbi:MAG: hypothetical protein JNK21_02205 [Rhodospirillaceae bacterium]|nr:hypothetical protein [Rhodospirillaceae bacterium]
MTAFNPERRRWLGRALAGAAGALVSVPAALAQDMGENGMAIPSFFFSGAERRAREACENKLPECRPNVRAQMSFERDISLLLPWAALAGALLAGLFYARKREKAKEMHRKLAQRRHVPGSFKNMGETRGEGGGGETDDRFS